MSKCLIPGCKNDATHNIGIRCRRPDTSAIWAPNTNGYLCDVHADQGYEIDITLTPKSDKSITTNVNAGGQTHSRTTPIQHEP